MSNGAPKHPNAQDEKQKGIQEVWDLLRAHNAVFLGDPSLQKDLDEFLAKNKIKREKPTDDQKRYNEMIKKAVETAIP